MYPLVSVITPCYNDGKYIMRTIQSVHNSHYSNIEHIIIDDGSTDASTLKVLSEINIPNVKVLYTNNQGVCKARNRAIRESSGKYILPVDGDDLISPYYISLAVDKLERNPQVKVIATNYKKFGRAYGVVTLPPFSLQTLICRNIFTVSSMFRREDYDRVGGYNENMKGGFEDWDFWLGLIEEDAQVHYLDGVHFYYRIKVKKKSRNAYIDFENLKLLRKQLRINHAELYRRFEMDVFETFECKMYSNSLEYLLGRLLLLPIRKIFGK